MKRLFLGVLTFVAVVSAAVGVGLVVADVWNPTRGWGAGLATAGVELWLLLREVT